MSAKRSYDPLDAPIFIYEDTKLVSNHKDLVACKENAIRVFNWHNKKVSKLQQLIKSFKRK